MRFEYWNSEDGTWTWQLKTSIDDVLARGNSFTSRDNCLSAIKLVKLAAGASLLDVTETAVKLAPPERALAAYPGSFC